jgi:hypothetical protein
LRKIAEEQSDSMGDISTLLEPDLVPILQTAFLNEKKGGD